MKKVLSLLLIVLCLLALCACGDTKAQDTSNANKLTYGVKYISATSVSLPEEEQIYYMFEEDEMIFHYYYKSTSGTRVSHYTLTFKYEIVDDGTLAYFFDGVEIHDEDTEHVDKDFSERAGLLMFSKNVLSTPDGTLCINETYLEEELGNFGA